MLLGKIPDILLYNNKYKKKIKKKNKKKTKNNETKIMKQNAKY